MEERIITSNLLDEDRELSIRPESLDEYVGQEKEKAKPQGQEPCGGGEAEPQPCSQGGEQEQRQPLPPEYRISPHQPSPA